MSLPIPARKTGFITIGGQKIAVRSLSAREVVAVRSLEDSSERNIYLIACAFDIDKDEAATWYDAVDASVALAVLEGVSVVSGMTAAEDTRFQAGDDAVNVGSSS